MTTIKHYKGNKIDEKRTEEIYPGTTFICEYDPDHRNMEPGSVYMMVNPCLPGLSGFSVPDVMVDLKTGLGTPCATGNGDKRKYIVLKNYQEVDIEIVVRERKK